MKRDMDFVRDILLGIEELDDGVGCNYTDLQFYFKKKGSAIINCMVIAE